MPGLGNEANVLPNTLHIISISENKDPENSGGNTMTYLSILSEFTVNLTYVGHKINFW